MFRIARQAALLISIMGTLTPGWVLAQAGNPSAAQTIDGEVLRDPTRPFSVARNSLVGSGNDANSDRLLPAGLFTRSNFNVTFIRDGGTSPMAVVNEQRVSVGDLIGGATVLAISSDGVTLSVNGLEQVITTFGPAVKEVSGTEF